MYDIIIVGGGTAGLSAAIYGVRAGRRVLVLEGKAYGGQIVYSTEVVNYPGICKITGMEFARTLYEQAVGLGAEFMRGHVVRVEKGEGFRSVLATQDDGTEREYQTKAVILATGARNRTLGLEREQELTGAGVSYCATCDGMFFRGRKVAVAGGGNTALEDAAFLSNYCEKVYVVHRRDRFRGEERLVENIRQKSNVEFILNTVVTGLCGDDALEGITLRGVVSGEEMRLEVSGLFVAIGQMPDNQGFLPWVSLDEQGYIQASEDCRTETPGIFVAGDCRTKEVRQLATAAADGAVSALAACKYIEK